MKSLLKNLIKNARNKESTLKITKYKTHTTVELLKDLNVCEFSKLPNSKLIEEIISNNMLFDTRPITKDSIIKKKKIYIIKIENKNYAILVDDTKVIIDERIDCKDHIDERELEINKEAKKFKITRQKHDNNKSTFYVKYYPLESNLPEYFRLEKEKAYEIIHSIIEGISRFEEIENLIDLESLENVRKRLIK